MLFILFTVVIGMTIFFAPTWAWVMAISPPLETPAEDFIDDLAALYHSFKVHIGRFSLLLTPFERALASPALCPIINWLNPRKNRWYAIALIEIGVGVFLALGEGHLHPPLGLLEIFTALGCLGVLMDYAFFVKPLGLVRISQEQPTPTYTSST